LILSAIISMAAPFRTRNSFLQHKAKKVLTQAGFESHRKLYSSTPARADASPDLSHRVHGSVQKAPFGAV
jgi:hypothetical protein